MTNKEYWKQLVEKSVAEAEYARIQHRNKIADEVKFENNIQKDNFKLTMSMFGNCPTEKIVENSYYQQAIVGWTTDRNGVYNVVRNTRYYGMHVGSKSGEVYSKGDFKVVHYSVEKVA